jgi:regulator of sigma E protease
MLTVVAFFVLLGVLITVHELGHFLVAKACGVRVLQFSIGFGPRLVGFLRGETEYRIGVLPLGGYVRMYGDDITQEVPAEERHRAFLTQPYLKKCAIAIAGPAANLVLPVALFFAMFIGKETVAEPVVGSVVEGDAAAAAGIRPGDRVLALDGRPVTLFSEMPAYVEPRPGTPIRVTVDRQGTRFDVVVTPRATPDPSIFDREKTVGRLGLSPAKELPVVAVDPEGPAAAAGIKGLDTIEKVDGTAVATKGELLSALDDASMRGTVQLDVVRDVASAEGASAQRFSVTLTKSSSPPPMPRVERFAVTVDELAPGPVADRVSSTMAVVRAQQAASQRRFGLFSVDGRVALVEPGDTVAAQSGLRSGEHVLVAIDGRPLRMASDLSTALEPSPDAIHAVGVIGPGGPRVLAFRMLPHPRRELGGMKIFGVQLTSARGEGAVVVRHVGPVEALTRAVDATRDLVVDVVRGFGLLFSGQVGLESLGGPLTIAKMSGQAASIGGAVFIQLMGLISVNLALINLLPVPVLDGGHLMMFTVEAVTRRRMSVETRMKITKVGLVLVGLLMIIAIGNDILGLF